ncbi:MAG: metalloregulator ArsR/SmtB family transcription factor [Spirochaetales bacterium]|nr:metalloregulator ArsR/SmtB family transcription factor [Spirochaetales bacterium]
MIGTEKEKYERRTEILKALAHPERLRITDILSRNPPLCVCDIQKELDINMSTLSRHLERLKKAKIVEDKREGRNIYYKLNFCCLDRFFSCVDSVIEECNCHV